MFRHTLIEIDWPAFGAALHPPSFPSLEYETRLDHLRQAMEAASLNHLAIYGDREHFANLHWLTGFDPRFEEALLLIDLERTPLMLTGIECLNYLPISPLFNAGRLRCEYYAPFSLPNISDRPSRSLEEILRDEGFDAAARSGVIGWKSYSHAGASDLPSYLIDTLRQTGARVTNATHLLIHPRTGLRTFAGARDIAFHEYSNGLAAEGMKRILLHIREGMTDGELLREAAFDGFPQGCHWGLKTGPHRISLASPIGVHIERGQPLSGNVCYRGSNCCRAGWVVESPADLPPDAADYVDAFAGPYFAAMAEWFRLLHSGSTGGLIHSRLTELLPASSYGVHFNPGHLLHYEEWLGSPIYADSAIPLHSGMLMQSDVIPSSPRYYSTRMEDTYALADHTLRRQIETEFPDCYARCVARREFLRRTLGLPIHDEVLPLSNLAGIVPPYLLRPGYVLAIES